MKSVKKGSVKKIFIDVKEYFVLRKKFFYVLGLIVVIGIVILFGTKIYLAFNLLIGNDALVRLTASDQDLFLSNSESVEIEFDTYVSANPFCKSSCEYSLKDLSSGEVLDRNSFDTIVTNPSSQKYTLYAPDKGEGQKLYRFGVSCVSSESGFCETTGEAIEKSFIVSLNYNLSEEQSVLREVAIEKLNRTIEDFVALNVLALENKYLFEVLSNRTLTKGLLKINLTEIEVKMNESLNEFRHYEYGGVISDVVNLSNRTLVDENLRLRLEVDDYNNFVLLVREEEAKLIGLSLEKNMSDYDESNVAMLIFEYNAFLSSLNSSIDVKKKTHEIGTLVARSDEIFLSLDKLNESDFVFDKINSSTLEFITINFSDSYESNLSILPEDLICSYDGIYGTCCDESCAKDSDKYPVILLHGHSFNSAISAEKSLGDLQRIREKLFLDGFLDGGDLILRSGNDFETFKKTRERIIFSVSYYFDIYKNTEETIVLETQSDNLDSYALRLNEIIKEVKAETGKDKVVIVAHSMGGLVSRKYLQIYGEDDVAELIMIGTPNHGIDGTTLSGCSILGEDKHCADMDARSLFMNKLNYGAVPKIPVENIIGIGCDTSGGNGDGVAKNSSVYLSWADNYYVNGTCEGFDYLHNKMILPGKYPEVYNLVRGFILEE